MDGFRRIIPTGFNSAAYVYTSPAAAPKSKRGVDHNYLALLVEGTLEQEPPPARDASRESLSSSSSGFSTSDDLEGRPLSKQVGTEMGTYGIRDG